VPALIPRRTIRNPDEEGWRQCSRVAVEQKSNSRQITRQIDIKPTPDPSLHLSQRAHVSIHWLFVTTNHIGPATCTPPHELYKSCQPRGIQNVPLPRLDYNTNKKLGCRRGTTQIHLGAGYSTHLQMSC